MIQNYKAEDIGMKLTIQINKRKLIIAKFSIRKSLIVLNVLFQIKKIKDNSLACVYPFINIYFCCFYSWILALEY